MKTDSQLVPAIAKQAHALAGFGYHLVPIAHGGKRPLIRWKDSPSSHAAIDSWFAHFGAINLAIHAGRSGVIVLDADSTAAAAWIERHCPDTPMTANTPRGGIHAYYRASKNPQPSAQNLFGLGLDVRAGNAIVLACPSWSEKHRRRWEWRREIVTPEALPILDASLLTRAESPRSEIEQQSIINPLPSPRLPSDPIRDVTRWIMAVDSIQGRGGSNQCFKVACRLVDAGFSWDEAWRWLCLWNGRKADPPWSEAELWHKLRGAFSRN